jgi:drug/metabolite transporter (DMT)-like permease
VSEPSGIIANAKAAGPISRPATLMGFGAIALWAVLAVLTTRAGPVPPFQLSAMAFSIGTMVGLAWARRRGQSLRVLWTQPLGAWLLGVYGLLAFHACYFFALQNAPPLEASLIIYLWPLLIVLLSGLVPAHLGGGAVTTAAIVGATLGFAGTVALLLDASGRPGFGGSLLGYALALAAALIWSSYSVASRLYRDVPSVAVIGSCALAALGSALLSWVTETPAWPQDGRAWLAVLGLGLGPVGLAFYLWDEGMKRGDMRLLGIASYATPIASTLILAAAGEGDLRPSILVAAVLVSAGAYLASRG